MRRDYSFIKNLGRKFSKFIPYRKSDPFIPDQLQQEWIDGYFHVLKSKGRQKADGHLETLRPDIREEIDSFIMNYRITGIIDIIDSLVKERDVITKQLREYQEEEDDALVDSEDETRKRFNSQNIEDDP